MKCLFDILYIKKIEVNRNNDEKQRHLSDNFANFPFDNLYEVFYSINFCSAGFSTLEN